MTKKEKQAFELEKFLVMNTNYHLTGWQSHITNGVKKGDTVYGYEIKTDLWDGMTEWEKESTEKVVEMVNCCFNVFKGVKSVELLAELVLIVNWKCWHYAGNGGHNEKLAALYSDLYYELHDWCMDNLKGEDLNYYYNRVN